jgi:DNA-binding CsgD family transcriptional regulator/tetratricopeptide (TPR) repeat protein
MGAEARSHPYRLRTRTRFGMAHNATVVTGRIAMNQRSVGRENELETLTAELARSATGAFRTVLLSGDPGMGKTRLAHELSSAASAGVTCLRARAHALGTSMPFGLWSEAFESHLRGLPADEVRSLCGGFVDDLAPLLRSAAVIADGVTDESSRARLLESIAVLLANIAATTPVIFVLDDAHLADASSWEALHYCARNLLSSPILTVLTARPGELTGQPGPVRVLFGLEQDGGLTRLDLGPLAREAVAELAESVLGLPPPPGLIAWLDARAKGNPMYILGLLQALQEEKADLTMPRLQRLPEGLTERVGTRLATLAEPARDVLDLLAAIGCQIGFADLAVLSGRRADVLGALLDGLVQSRLVTADERSGELAYEIAHPLVQEAIYQGLGVTRRRSVHRQVGHSLLATGRLGEAAPHIARSAEPGDPDGVEVLCQAVRQAESRQAYREALIILGSLAEVLPANDERWLAVLDGMVLDADWIVDHRADVYGAVAVPALRAIDGMLPPSVGSDRRAALKFRLGTFLTWGTGEVDEAQRFNTEAWRLFDAAGNRSGALLAALEDAFIEFARGNVAGWVPIGRRVAEEAEAAGDPYVEMHALGRGVGFGALTSGAWDEAEEAFRKAVMLARENGRPYFESLSQLALGLTVGLQGRIDEMEPFLNDAKAVNPCWQEGCILEFEAVVRWLSGDFEATLECARESVAWNPGGMSRRRGFAMAFGALASAESNRLPEAERFLAVAHAAYEGRPFAMYTDLVAAAGAVCSWRAGSHPESPADLERAATMMLDKEAWPWAAFAFSYLAEMGTDSRRPDVTARAVAGLEVAAERLDRGLYSGLAALARAGNELVARRAEEAAKAARDALEHLPAACQVFTASARELLGRALLSLDRPAARRSLETAAAQFDACSATFRRDRALQRLRRLGHAGKRAAASLGDATLTPRELDVARLAATGHTAPEIAQQLVIGTRTVETHLVRIYAKLGIASKRELVQRAIEFDLSR